MAYLGEIKIAFIDCIGNGDSVIRNLFDGKITGDNGIFASNLDLTINIESRITSTVRFCVEKFNGTVSQLQNFVDYINHMSENCDCVIVYAGNDMLNHINESVGVYKNFNEEQTEYAKAHLDYYFSKFDNKPSIILTPDDSIIHTYECTENLASIGVWSLICKYIQPCIKETSKFSLISILHMIGIEAVSVCINPSTTTTVS